MKKKKERGLKSIKELKNLVKRKRKSLGIPDGKIRYKHGGRDVRREMVRMRDGHKCQICQLKWKEGMRALDVHHLDEDSKKTRQFDSVEEFSNMITLCHSCHFKLHHRKVSIPAKVLTKIGAVV